MALTRLAYNMAWLLWLALPCAWVWLQLPQRSMIILPYDALSEFGICTLVAWRLLGASRRDVSMPRARWLLAAMALLGVGDGLFVFCLGRDCPVVSNVAAEMTLTGAFTMLSLWLALTMPSRGGRRGAVARWGVVAFFTAASALLQYHFVLRPLEASVPPFTAPLRLNYFVYSAVTALVFGLCCYMSLAATRTRHLLFLHGLLLMQVSEFLARYYLAVHHYAYESDATAGWTSGVGLLFYAVAYRATGPAERKWAWMDAPSLAELSSVRVLLAGSYFAVCGAAVVLCLKLRVLHTDSAIDLTRVMAVMLAVWAAANFSVSRLTRLLKQTTEALPSSRHLFTQHGGGSALDAYLRRHLPVLQELRQVARRYNVLTRQVRDLSIHRQALARVQATSDLALQVAHDIRSPAAALGALLPHLGGLPAEQQSLAHGIIERINHIAHSMLARSRSPVGQEAPSDTCLAELVSEIVAEKKLEWRVEDADALSVDIADDATDLTCPVPYHDLYRVLSNILNNAHEASDGVVRVAVELRGTPTQAILTVRDGGRGIRPAVLERLGEVPVSQGKSGGHGFGLFHAVQVVRVAGGSLVARRQPGGGSSVCLHLPLARPAMADARPGALGDPHR